MTATAPSGTGWKSTVSVNGAAPVELTPSGGTLTVPSFALVAGANTVALASTYTPPAPTLKITNTINAPSGSPQAETQLSFSGSCPSSFSTGPVAAGGSISPALTGAVNGSSCSITATAPSGTGWKSTVSVNGAAAVELTPSGGTLTIPSFALVTGANTVTLTSTYTPVTKEGETPVIPDPTAGGWQLNGTAKLEAPNLVLTTATSNQAGSAFWPTAVNPANLNFEFTISIGGGTGADGQTFTIADATKGAKPTSLGEQGGGLGFAKIPGLAVAFDTYKNSANPSSNFIGISNEAGTTAGTLHWLTTYNPLASSLRTGTHKVKISTDAGAISVWLDGTKLGSQTVTLPTSAYIGFSGGTGGMTDRHAVSGLTVTGEGGEPPPKEEPKPASLKITNAVSAPSGSSQAETQLSFSGSCPSSFTAGPLGNGGSATPALTGAVAGSVCSVTATAPSGTGWKSTVSVNGAAPVESTPSGGTLTVPSFALVAGANTVALASTYTPPAPTLKITNTINAPSGSPQAETQLSFSGSCPSSFSTGPVAAGGSISPALTGAVNGSSCSITATAPSGTGWKSTVSVNGAAAVELTPSGGTLTIPSFALVTGANTVTLTSTYTPVTKEGETPVIPDPTAGGWQLNGTAKLEAPNLVLTTATSNQAGSAFWPTAVNPANLNFEFTISIGGGTGADGQTFTIADATKGAKPTSLGEQGGGLGFAKIPGLAVAFDTYKNSANPSSNFIGISNEAGTTAGTLHWLTTYNPLASSLRTGTHKVKISTDAGAISVWLDGTKLGSQTVTLPTSAYIGFSGGTGGMTDRHAVSGLTVAGG